MTKKELFSRLAEFPKNAPVVVLVDGKHSQITLVRGFGAPSVLGGGFNGVAVLEVSNPKKSAPVDRSRASQEKLAKAFGVTLTKRKK
jgi:hypothetical protein